MDAHLLTLSLLISSSLIFPVTADQSVSYFSWFPATYHKTITFIPSMEYDNAVDLCNKMEGRLLTFNWNELLSIISDVHRMYGATDYWIGLTREYGVVRWADGAYFHPSSGFNISFASDQNEKSCAVLQVMNGNNNYLIQMTNCGSTKKAICESWKPIGLFGILTITALGISILCLILVCVILVRSFMANKNTTYVMKASSGREVASDK